MDRPSPFPWRRMPPAVLAVLASFALAFPVLAAPDRPTVTPPPVDLNINLDTRIREVSLHNLLDFRYDPDQAVGKLSKASDTHFFRVRHRIAAALDFRGGWRLASRFTTEWRKYLTPYESPAKTQIILDNFYLDVPQLGSLPVALRVGRQDLIRGEGFVLLEGGPLDGSRSIYHNAILVTLDGQRLGLDETTLDLVAIRNPAWDPIVLANGPSDEQRALGRGKIVENDETAAGLYVTNRTLAKQTLEGYYLYKEEEHPAVAEPQLMLHTVGARATGELPWSLRYGLEGALQFGTHELLCSTGAGWEPCGCSYDHRAGGGYLWLRRSFLTFFQPVVKIGALYLSGDDRDETEGRSASDGDWYPVFSRWPKWSELYLYTLLQESRRLTQIPGAGAVEAGRIGYWTNTLALHAGLSLDLTDKTQISYTYYYLRAPHAMLPDGQRDGFFADGHARGHNHQWKLTTRLGATLSWHFLVERFAPGDFYDDAQDDAYFLRWELMWKK